MLGEMAVKHMAMLANKRPAKKANGIISKDSGSSISPKTHNTGSIMVANTYKIKNIPSRKTDIKDSEWIAKLCLNGMIEPSRIFPKEDRELRDLTRAIEALVNSRTQVKNRVHRVSPDSSVNIL